MQPCRAFSTARISSEQTHRSGSAAAACPNRRARQAESFVKQRQVGQGKNTMRRRWQSNPLVQQPQLVPLLQAGADVQETAKCFDDEDARREERRTGETPTLSVRAALRDVLFYSAAFMAAAAPCPAPNTGDPTRLDRSRRDIRKERSGTLFWTKLSSVEVRWREGEALDNTMSARAKKRGRPMAFTAGSPLAGRQTKREYIMMADISVVVFLNNLLSISFHPLS